MFSVPVDLIAWKDRPKNDPLCVERDVKATTVSLTTQLYHCLLIIVNS